MVVAEFSLLIDKYGAVLVVVTHTTQPRIRQTKNRREEIGGPGPGRSARSDGTVPVVSSTVVVP